ncbi:MAG: O-antigen ligase domain-containing protein [Clostridia bacterium]|nr:O-antigen ligase domain-containing protein [Clostridia bacterium]
MIIKLMFSLSIIVSAEIIILFIRAGGTYDAIRNIVVHKHIYLGWGGANHVGAILALCIPANFYYMLKCKKIGFAFVIIAFIQFCLMIMTRSRGALLFTTAALPIMFIYVMVKSKRKLPIGITAAVLIAGTLAMMLIFKNSISDGINIMLAQGFDDSGRFELWKQGLDYFKNYPIFGVGWDIGVDPDDLGWSPLTFHAMFIQIMASAGVVGMVFFAYYYWARYSTFFRRRTNETWTVLAGMLLLEAYGMIDPISLFPTTYFLMLVMMSLAAEQAMPDDMNRPILFVKQPWKNWTINMKARKNKA